MPGRRLILLAALLAGMDLRASLVRVEPASPGRSGPITVSWELPRGFDESELLVEIQGGPRVRLTGEIEGRSPQVTVTLPRLAGRARFVVRAGREHGSDEDEESESHERDVAWSESFTLDDEPPTSRVVPVRAASTRSLPGSDMEWWAEPPSSGKEGPGCGISESQAGAAIEGDPAPALETSRQDSPPPVASSRVPDPARHPARRPAATPPPESPPFPGAATPLRN